MEGGEDTKAIPSPNPGDYLVVEDREKKTTWHLQVKENGVPNHRLMGAAWAALHGGYRGNKYEGPGKQEAISKLTRLYAREGMDTPKSIEVEEDDELVFYGEPIKALGDGKLGGYLVRFSGDSEPDLTGEYFTKETDFGDATTSPVYYQHGMDPVIKKRKLSKAELSMDDFGVWAETQLNMRDEYEKFIYQMAEKGQQGWSSGTASHLIEREKKGNAIWLRSWPLGLDASITPTPAEPRNGVIPLKSINVEPLKAIDEPKDTPTEEAVSEGEAEQEVGKDKFTVLKTMEGHEMEITEERLAEMIDQAVKTAVAPPKEEVKEEPKPEVDIEAAVAAGVEQAMKKLPGVFKDVKVETDEGDQPFESPGQYFQAVKTAALYGQVDARLLPLKATGLSEGVPSDGGYLLTPQIAGGILENMWGGGEILQRVAADTIGPNSNSMLYNAVSETSRANGSRFGGLLGYWMAEAGTITASQPVWRQMELKLKKVAALCYATDELLADATALESWLARTVPAELRFRVEDAIYNGDGVGKPLGIMQSPALVSVTRIDANEVDQTDIANMWSRRYTGVNDYVWLANSEVFPQLINLTVGNFPFLLPMNAGGQGNPAFSLYGAPYIEVEYAAALGTTGDIMLASLSQYQTIVKGGVQAASSIHVNFTADETAFRFIYRTDGEPLWNSAVESFASSATTKSPFVVLTAASA